MKPMLLVLFYLLGLAPTGYAQNISRQHVGILLASHGDIDSLAELKPYLKTFALHMAPLPGPLSNAFVELAWPAARAKYETAYKAIGITTHYRENSRKQAEALGAQLATLGVAAKVYVGFNLLAPTVANALDAMRADGIDMIIVLNQGAQFSMATQMNYADVIQYLKAHPAYQPHVMGINQYASDERFRTLLTDAVREDVATYFPHAQNDVCVLMAFHGLPQSDVKRGEPATRQMVEDFASVRDQLPEYRFYYGFLNEDLIPFVNWTTPSAMESARAVGSADCHHILLDARISFTVNPRIALYDLNVVARQEILRENPSAEVVFAHNFDGDRRLAAYFAQIIVEALRGEGDLQHLSAASMPGHHHVPH